MLERGREGERDREKEGKLEIDARGQKMCYKP